MLTSKFTFFKIGPLANGHPACNQYFETRLQLLLVPHHVIDHIDTCDDVSVDYVKAQKRGRDEGDCSTYQDTCSHSIWEVRGENNIKVALTFER